MVACHWFLRSLFHFNIYIFTQFILWCTISYPVFLCTCISCNNTSSVKKVWPSEVKSYLKGNAWRDWQQRDLISECGQGLAYWIHKYCAGLLIVSYFIQNLIGLVCYQSLYVTGYWKTDHNVTLGQLLFIGPANSHNHILSVHCCINGLSWLVCFFRASFADHVKSLRQWGPWRPLDGRYGADIHLCVGEMSLKALQSCLGLWLALLALIATPNSQIGWCNLPAASHSSPPLTPTPSHPPTPLYVQAVIHITVVVKKVAQNPAVLASYYRSSLTTSQNTALVIWQI